MQADRSGGPSPQRSACARHAPMRACNRLGRRARMSTTAPTFAYDFFISRRGSVAAEAQEVADILEAEGFRVIVQDCDFASSGQFVLDIDRALKQARHLLILYSHDYHSSFWRDYHSSF